MSVLSRATAREWAARANDFYATIDARAIAALAPHVPAGTVYAEPCAGAGDLVHLLAGLGLQCAWACDIAPQCRTVGQWDAMQLCAQDVVGVECFITNPPWTRPLLHPLIEHLASLRPTWMLFDAAWMFTGQAAPLMALCTDVVAVGRLRWFHPKPAPLRVVGESEAAYRKRAKKARGMDPPGDHAWYRFDARAGKGNPLFHPRIEKGCI